MVNIKKDYLSLHAGIFFLFFVSLAPLTALAENTVYVRPQSKVTIRAGQGNDFKIVAMASTGQKLTLLEEGDGWSRVRTRDGKEGWILERFLSSDAPLEDVVQDLQGKLDAAGEKEKRQVAQISELSTRLAENEHQLSQCRQQHDEVASSYEALKRDTANVIEMRRHLEGQEEEHRQLITRLDSLETENRILKKEGAVNWFLAGGGVFLLGWLLGLINRKSKRSRSSLL
jgi:SH3 domain protein